MAFKHLCLGPSRGATTPRAPEDAHLLTSFSTMRLDHPAEQNFAHNLEYGNVIGRECRNGVNDSASLSSRCLGH